MEASLLSSLDQQLRYFKTVIQYLDNSGNLKLIKAQCEKYRRKKVVVFTFKLLLDFPDLCEANAELSNLLIQQPVEASYIFQEVLYKIILVLELLPVETTLSQIAVILRLSSLPRLGDINVIQSVPCLSRVFNTKTFCVLVGMVTGLSAISKYTQSTQYFCPEEYCDGHKGNHYIRVHTAGASEAQTIRKDFKCKFCCSILIEEKSKRSLSDKRVAEIMPMETLSNIHSNWDKNSRGQAIPVFVRDDLTKSMEIGETYEIVGIVRKDIHDDKITLMIEANNVVKVKEHISAKSLLQKIPENILKLYKDRKSSPWSFVLTLAYFFGGDISPPGSYFSLKLAMLLSLLSKFDKKVKPVHLLAIGNDTETVPRLLRFGMRFLDKSCALTAGQPLGGLVTQDKYNSAQFFVEGGALHISQSGVCYLGDINRLKKQTVERLQSVITNQKIATDVGSKFTNGLPQHFEQPLKSCVWGYSGPSSNRKGLNLSDDDALGIGYTGDLSKTLLEAFSLLCFTDCGDSFANEEIESQLIEQTLVTAMLSNDTASNLPITAHDFQQFLKFAGKLRPVFTKKAESLIHSYYLTCRKSRATNSNNVPLCADQTLLSLAYSHAKLALNTEVTVQDAIMAIKLYEESLIVRFGLSELSVYPMPHVTRGAVNECLGPQNDLQMQHFYSNLLRYCSMATSMEE